MFEQLLEQIGLELDRRGVPYMLVGGQAVLLYGEPRLTRDIDVTLGIGADRLPEILDLVGSCGWRVLVDEPAAFVERTLVLPCENDESGVRLDFIFSFSPYEQEALGRVRRVPVGKAQVRFASVEDVIIHKMVAGRPRDLEDVRGILLKTAEVDFEYIRRWLGEFDRSLGETFLERLAEVRRSTTD